MEHVYYLFNRLLSLFKSNAFSINTDESESNKIKLIFYHWNICYYSNAIMKVKQNNDLTVYEELQDLIDMTDMKKYIVLKEYEYEKDKEIIEKRGIVSFPTIVCITPTNKIIYNYERDINSLYYYLEEKYITIILKQNIHTRLFNDDNDIYEGQIFSKEEVDAYITDDKEYKEINLDDDKIISMNELQYSIFKKGYRSNIMENGFDFLVRDNNSYIINYVQMNQNDDKANIYEFKNRVNQILTKIKEFEKNKNNKKIE